MLQRLQAQAVSGSIEMWANAGYATLPDVLREDVPARPFESLHVGQWEIASTFITRAKVFLFALASGDWNPLHFSFLFAAGTRFKKPIAHGLLVAASISAMLARDLPGLGTLYESQSLFFTGPVFIGDEITTVITITAIDMKDRRVTLACDVFNQNSEQVLHGEAVVRLPKPRAA